MDSRFRGNDDKYLFQRGFSKYAQPSPFGWGEGWVGVRMAVSRLRRCAFSILLSAMVGGLPPAQAGDADLLKDYALVICLSGAYQAGPTDYHVAARTLKEQAWWFVEHTGAAPETYDRIFSAALAFGATLPPETAAVGCAKWRSGADVTALFKAP